MVLKSVPAADVPVDCIVYRHSRDKTLDVDLLFDHLALGGPSLFCGDNKEASDIKALMIAVDQCRVNPASAKRAAGWKVYKASLSQILRVLESFPEFSEQLPLECEFDYLTYRTATGAVPYTGGGSSDHFSLVGFPGREKVDDVKATESRAKFVEALRACFTEA